MKKKFRNTLLKQVSAQIPLSRILQKYIQIALLTYFNKTPYEWQINS